MPTVQACAVNQVVARAVHLPADPGRWVAERRRDDDAAADLASFAEHVMEVGRRAGLTFLQRALSAPELTHAVREGAFPLVLLLETGPGAFEGIVLLRRRGSAAEGCVVGADGSEASMRLPADGVWAALAARAPGLGRTVLALAPVALAAARGRADEAAGSAGTTAPHPTPVRRLAQLLAQERGHIGLVYLYAVLVGLFSLTLPLGVQAIYGLVSGGLFLQPVVLLIGFVILGTIGTGVLQILQLGVVETLQQRVFARLALEFSLRLPRIETEAVAGDDLPEMMNRFFEVVAIQKSLAKLLTDATTALLSVVFGLALLTFYHPYFSLFGLLLLAILALILWITGRAGMATSLAESKYKYRVAHWLQELARAVTLFKFAGRSRVPVERMDGEVAGYLKYRQKHFRVIVGQAASIIAFKTLITGGLLVLGSLLVINRQITLGQFVASEVVIVMVLAGVEKLIGSLSTVYDVLTAVEKVGHVGDLPLESDGGRALPPAPDRGIGLTLRGLHYRYPGGADDVLRGVDLTVRPGERVAITGTEGAGESTLLRVVAGLLPSYRGTLVYDGVSARDLSRARLRELIAMAESEVTLFDGTIEENVALARPHVGLADVLRAIDDVGLADYVHALPGGLGTRVGGGARLPSHVERRITLARALAGRPRLLLFDEFFHHLEPGFKRDVVRRVTARDAAWTVLAVSHDPVFLAECDRVYVLTAGEVSWQGTYDELCDDPALRALVAVRGEHVGAGR